jgi:hypothetical protein
VPEKANDVGGLDPVGVSVIRKITNSENHYSDNA